MTKETISADNSSIASHELVQAFNGQHATEEPQLQRSQSVLHKMHSKVSFFNERLRVPRRNLSLKFLMIQLIMGTGILAIFSIYWGSFYDRSSRLKNLRMLVVIEDDSTVNGVEPAIGNAMKQLLQSATAKAYGDWLIQNTTEFLALAASHGNDIYAEIKRQVHHQRYWASIYVQPNASANFYQAIVDGNTTYDVLDNTITAYYETGRDLMGMNSYITPGVRSIQQMFLKLQPNITSALMSNLSDLTSASLLVLSTPLEFNFVDGIPFTDPVLTAPCQVGLIYLVIVTLFAFNFLGEVHSRVAKMGVKPLHLVLYRVLSTILTFFIISFFYSLVTLAFQVDFTKAFGHSGWLVYWMTNFLTMWAVGAMNETMAMLCILVYPPLVGFWLLFWVVLNISGTFSPIALTPHFYRYSYAMPIHAAFEITKVIFLDTYKGAMGRNYAILIIWVVMATVGLVFSFKLFGQTMAKRAMAERMKIEEEVLAKHEMQLERDP